jgi:predicted O-linked N-acetylglucosamine transferase (SPINDLY family)
MHLPPYIHVQHYQKNHEFIIDTFYEILQKNPDSVLLLIGEGELMQEINKRVSELGIGESVIFTGVRSDINDLMQAMDLLRVAREVEEAKR